MGGKSFVYNKGSSEDDKKEDQLRFNFGVFFDGTLNNMYNTDARRKSRNETKDSFIDTQSDKYKNDLAREASAREKVLEDKKNGGLADVGTPERRYQDYLLGVERSEQDQMGTDNSYSNDYTNVARMWTCCKENYRIYIEGMGSKELQQDSQDGFAFGAGETGIRGRVRTACEKVAEKILDAKRNTTRINKIKEITIDIFGFSRGAASARNFAYEIKKDQTKPDVKQILVGVKNGPARTPIYKDGFFDEDGIEVNKDLLIDDYLPPHGHLGLSLYKDEDVNITPEELKDITLNIRFIGIYDTVSSYYEEGKLGSGGEELKAASEFLGPTNFANDVEELHLNDIECQKMVHFTAQDEHRKNFSLTQITPVKCRAIEKSFPGVHCDIGGAYENGPEIIDEIATRKNDGGKSGVKKIVDNLLENYWYEKHELEEKKQTPLDISIKAALLEKLASTSLLVTPGGLWLRKKLKENTFYHKLTGTKKIVRKEYSYIPLHFMDEYARKTSMLDFISDDVEDKYPLETATYQVPGEKTFWDKLFNRETKEIIDYLGNDGRFLERIKKNMRGYVMETDDDAYAWEFKTDEQIADENRIKAEAEFEASRDEIEAEIEEYTEKQKGWKESRRIILKQKEEEKYKEKVFGRLQKTVVTDGQLQKTAVTDGQLSPINSSQDDYINNEQPVRFFINDELVYKDGKDYFNTNDELVDINGKLVKDGEEYTNANGKLDMSPVNIEEVSVTPFDLQKDLRILRHDYCHYSATRDYFGMEPNDDRKRRHYNKPTA